MSDDLPQKTNMGTAAARLELMWVKYPGPWDDFVLEVEKGGNELECEVLRLWPQEFKAAAQDRASRIDAWGENRLTHWLENMEDIALRAEKFSKDGGKIPDNGARFQATKFLVERVVGRAVERDDKGSLGRELDVRVDRRNELVEALRNRGVKITEIERSIEVDG